MKKPLLLLSILSILLIPLLSYTAFAEERAVLTIGDITDRTDSRIDGDDQLGLWQYLEDQLDVEIKFVYLTAEAYATGLSSGNLPDIVLYDDPAPLYHEAFEWVLQLGDYDTLLVIGTSYFTWIAAELKKLAERNGARVLEINEDAEHKVRAFLENNHTAKNSDRIFFARKKEGKQTVF